MPSSSRFSRAAHLCAAKSDRRDTPPAPQFWTAVNNLVHCEDYKDFNLSVGDYFKRYFIGHYNPAGNHFFAYALKDRVVDWLDPKPLPYRDTAQQIIDFKGYLQEY